MAVCAGALVSGDRVLIAKRQRGTLPPPPGFCVALKIVFPPKLDALTRARHVT